MKRLLMCCWLGVLWSISAIAQDLTLWYDKPALRWEESVPLGNGLIGMMPNGNVQDESIVLNEISMWSGSPQDPNNDQAHLYVEEIQKLLFEGKNDLAEALVNKHFVCKGQGSGHGNVANVPYGCFQNVGFLHFLHFIEGTATNYRRTLDLSSAKATTSFDVDGTTFLREYFTSFDKNVGVVRLSSNKKQSISFALHFYREENVQDMQVQGDEIWLQGNLPDGKGGKGLSFAGGVKVVAKGGTKQVYDHQIIIKEADEVLVYFSG